MDIKQDMSWIQKHERLIGLLMLLLFLVFGVNKYINYRTEVDGKAAAVIQYQLDQQKKSNEELAQQMKEQVASYQTLIANLTQQNQSLASAIQNRNNTLVQQQQKNNNMTAPELVAHWSGVVPNTTTSDFQLNNGVITVSENGARQTVNELEKVAVLEADNKDKDQIISNQDKEIQEGTKTISGLNNQISGLNTQIVLQDKKCTADIKELKDKERKSKIKYFFSGTVLGAVAKAALKFAL